MCRSQEGTDRRPSVDMISPSPLPSTRNQGPCTTPLQGGALCLVPGSWSLFHVHQTALDDPSHDRGSDRAAVVRSPLGLIQNHDDAELRVVGGREPDAPRDVFLVRVFMGPGIELL